MHIPGATCAATLAATVALSAAAFDGRQTKVGSPAPAAPFEILWQRPLLLPDDAKLVPGLVVGDALVFVASPEAGLTALAPEDGHAAWSSALLPNLGPVLAGNRIAVAANGALQVLSQRTGEPDWQSELEPDTLEIFAFADRFAAITATEMRTWEAAGSLAWRTPLGGSPVTPVVFRNGVLYVGLDEPSIVAIDADTGTVRWRVRLPAKPESLVAADDRLYLSAADAALYSYRTSGEPDWAWKFPLLRAIGQPIVDDRKVYFALLDNTVRGFERMGGTQQWSHVLPSRPLTGPFQAGASLVIALTTGQVVELSPMEGKIHAPATPAAPAAPVTPAAPLPSGRLQSACVARDGSRVYAVTIARDLTRTLSAWGRPAAK